MLLLYPGELYRLLGASSFTIAFSGAFLAFFSAMHVMTVSKFIFLNDSQNLAFVTSHFVIELLPFDYLSNQKQ
jgi:hypothetical protein